MFDYRGALERRISQFAKYLRPMNHRAHEIAQSNCFIIFEERQADADSGQELVEKKELALQAVRDAFGSLGIGNSSVQGEEDFGLPDHGWREDNSQSRFIQFSIENKWFCMDMPLQTLYREEAEEILRYSSGFFYLRDRKQFTLYGEDVEGYDPFRKVYVYGDEESAAGDMAFIFFQTWKFPVESRFYLKAASFNGKHEWEQGVPIE